MLAPHLRVDEALQHLAAVVGRSLGHTFCRISTPGAAGAFDVQGAYYPAGRPSWPELRSEALPSDAVPVAATLFRRDDNTRTAQLLDQLSDRLRLGEKRLQGLLVVPIVQDDGTVLGVLDVGEQRRNGRSTLDNRSLELAKNLSKEIATVVAIAQAASDDIGSIPSAAVDQAEVICKLLRSNELHMRLEQASRELWKLGDFANLLHTVARSGANLIDCDKSALLTYRPSQHVLEFNAVFGLAPELVGRQVNVGPDLQPLVEDRAGPYCIDSIDVAAWGVAGAELRGRVLGVPVKQGGAIEHVLLIGEPRNRPFGALEEEIVDRFAHHVAATLEMARLVNPELQHFRPLPILQKIGDYIQSTADEHKILHAVLTGITARYGLGFNRAALFMSDDESLSLTGVIGIGQLDIGSARDAWQKDRQNKLDDFERYSQLLDQGALPEEQLDKEIKGMKLTVGPAGSDAISHAVRARHSIRTKANGAECLPVELLHIFEPNTETVVVPLVARQRVIGAMVCDYKHSQAPIRSTDIESLNLFARTAAVAVENRRRSRLLFQASSTVISKDAKDLLQMLLDQTLKAAQATWVKLIQIDPVDTQRFKMVSESHRSGGRKINVSPTHVRPTGISRTVMQSKKAFPIENIEEAPPGQVNPVLAKEGIKAALCLPWMLGEEALGVMWLHYRNPTKFAKQEIDDLQTYVNYVAAVWSDRQQMLLMERTQKTFATIATATTHDDDETLSSIVQGTKDVIGCDTVTLYMHNETDDTLVCPRSQMVGVEHEDPATRRRAAAENHFVYELFRRDEPYVARDAAADEFFKTSRFTRDEHIRSVAAVPLIGRGSVHVGILFVSYKTPNAFLQEDLDNIQLFANHAAIAIQNAKLFADRRRQLEENAVLAELSEKLLGSVTAQDIMDSAVRTAKLLLGADRACIALRDQEEQIRVRSAAGWEAEHMAQTLPAGAASHAGYTMSQDEPVVVDNFDTETRFSTPEFRKQQGTTSGIGVRMMGDGKVIGALLVHTREHRVFNQADTKFLSLIANQATIALTTAEHADTIAKQKGLLDALRLATEAILHSRMGDPSLGILKTILQHAVDSLAARKGAHRILGTLQLYEEKEEALVFKLFYPDKLYSDEAAVTGGKLPVNTKATKERGITARAFLERRPQRVDNVGKDHDYRGFNDQIRSELAVPLVDGRRALGVLNVESALPQAFDQQDEETLMALASLAVIVLRNSHRSDALANLGHEIRQPISTIQRDAESLKAEGSSGVLTLTREKRHAAATRIYDEARRLSRIHANVLSLTFLTEGATVLNNNPCDLMALVYEETDELSWEARQRSIDLLEPEGYSLTADVDHAKIRQAVRNVLFNAIRFATSRVQVSVSSDTKDARIAVTDDGIGIDPRHHEVIFERFHRIDPSPGGGDGSGLGLAIAKEYAQLHGGRIEVKSRKGEGAIFTIVLPLHKRREGAQ